MKKNKSKQFDNNNNRKGGGDSKASGRASLPPTKNHVSSDDDQIDSRRQRKKNVRSTKLPSTRTKEIDDQKPSATSEIWFELVDNDGNPYEETTTDKVTLPSTSDVAEFRKKLKAEYGEDALKGVARSALVVFKNKDAFDKSSSNERNREALKSSHLLAEFGRSENETLIVLVPSSASAKKQKLEAISSASTENETDSITRTIIDNSTWESLLACVPNVSLDQSGIFLDMGVETLGDTDLSYGLFVREEYQQVFQIIKKQRKKYSDTDRILVVGSPGIGKSVFGVLFFLLALKEKKNVAYRPMGGYTYYFNPNGDKYHISIFPKVGCSYEGYFDGNEKDEVVLNRNRFHIAYLFSSPCASNYNQFKKTAFRVYLNPWTKQECTELYKIRFDSKRSSINQEEKEDEKNDEEKEEKEVEVKEDDEDDEEGDYEDNDDEWYQRYNLVGGKPGFLFSKTKDFDAIYSDLNEGIPKSLDELEDLIQNFEGENCSNKMKHIAFNMYRDTSDPSSYFLTFSSWHTELLIGSNYKKIRGIVLGHY